MSPAQPRTDWSPNRFSIATWSAVGGGIAVWMALGTQSPWVAPAGALWWLACAAIGAGLLRRFALPGELSDPAAKSSVRVFVATALGVGVTLMVTSASAWLSGSTAIAAVVIGLWGIGSWRHALWLYRTISNNAGWLIVCSIALGAHHQVLEGVVRGSEIIFTDRWGDYRYHLHLGNLIRAHGMPLVDPYNWPETPFAPLGHRGIPLLIAHISDFAQVGAHDAGRILAIGSYPLLAGGGWMLAAHVGKGRVIRWLGAISAVCWAPATAWVNSWRAWQRTGSEAALAQLSTADPFYFLTPAGLAGGAYHNLPQLVSVGVLAVGLGTVGQWNADRPKWDATCTSSLLVAATLVGVSGLLKPSGMVIAVPALTIVLLLRRADWRSWLALLGPVVATVLIYLLPRFVVGAQSYQGVAVDISVWTWRKWSSEMGLAIGLVWLPGLVALSSLRAAAMGKRQWGIGQLLLIAGLGAVLFATLFVEVDAEKRSHGNMTWGLAGLLPLAAVTVWGLAQRAWTSKAAWLRVVGATLAVVALVQLLPGVLYAGRYPTVRKRTYPAQLDKDFVAIARGLPRGERVLVDPTIRASDLLPRLDRRIVTKMAFSPPPRKRWKAWSQLVYHGERKLPLPPEGRPVLAVHDAVIVRAKNPYLRAFMQREGFEIVPSEQRETLVLMRRKSGADSADR